MIALINNRATENGGGIENSGALMITNSTISGNRADGATLSSGGGAIHQWDSVATLVSVYSTIAHNQASSTAHSGLWIEGGALTVHNTILANNGDGEQGVDNLRLADESRFTSLGHNLSNDWNGAPRHLTDLTADPRLAALAVNGTTADNIGPTHDLLPDSPALDGSDGAACPVTDQRGVARPRGVACDIGALEGLPQADLALTQSGTPALVLSSEPVTYTLTMINQGPSVATSVALTTLLPVQATLLGNSAGCQATAGLVVCALADLASGESATVRLTAQFPITGTMINRAVLASAVADPVLSNNQTQAQLQVITRPETMISSQPLSVTTSNRVTITFSGVDGGAGVAGFECAVDNGTFANCSSPQSYSNLALGDHLFQVRVYDSLGNRDLTPVGASWVVTPAVVPPPTDVTPEEGGVVIDKEEALTMTFPAGIIDAGINVTITPLGGPPQSTSNLVFAGKAFSIIARDSNNQPVTSFTQPFTLVLSYSDSDWQAAGIIDETQLNLYFWNGNAWQALLPCDGCTLDTVANRVTVKLDHLTEFALLAPVTAPTLPMRHYVPLVHR